MTGRAGRSCMVILNPAARREKADRIWARSLPASFQAEMVLSRAPGHATELARKAAADGFSVVAAAGGDGTVNEVANGLVGTGAALGILPIGSVNVLAAELGIPRKLQAAWRVMVAGRPKRIDLGRVNSARGSHHFVQLAGAGLDARAVSRVSRDLKRRWGPLAYVFAGLKAAAESAPMLRVEVEGLPAAEGVCAIFGNGRYYGGPFKVLKDAALDDGLLDVCLFRKPGLCRSIGYLAGILRGSHLKDKDVWYAQVRRARVSSCGEVPVEVDGEYHGTLPVEMEVVPGALSVMVP